ncbi:carbohydrate kinase [Plantactinospora sp. S1510]|uniref:Carbohydrate kinase n=1 Tax=Plantactinospora alkalitolerans TaxID=2789879 RepID=A0ABS0H0A0_9ACTN|nr:FGGY family carbohydrate kinase [Plantactinospora alkalitolerans]MBF9131633.1 carbohydrate kinase [Plantactinospora alkalitolerans]
MRILALDLGTSSVRGLVLDAAARPLPGALARRPADVVIGDTGEATLDARAYLGALIECLDELAGARHLDGVELVVASAQWHSVVPLDPGGGPLGPVLTWLDTRPVAPAGVRGPQDADAFHRRTGTWWHRFYWSVRLPWLRERAGDGRMRFAGLVEYIFGMLLDEEVMSISQASGTGLLDLRTLDWDPEACELAGVRPGELPALAAPSWSGRLRADFARRWPALRTARWAPPSGDGAASNVGSGCFDTRRAAVTVGTSAAVRLVQRVEAGAELPPLPEELWRYRVDHDHVVTGTAFSGGGSLYAWARREMRLPDGPELDQALARIPPGSGVPADPRLGGDRPPGLAPAGSGMLAGLGFNTTSVDILAGLMGALCVQVAVGVAAIESTLDASVQVVLGGGAVAASGWWRRTFAVELAPREVHHVRNPEIGAVGAALVAIGRLDGATGLERIVRTDEDESATATRSDRPQYPS